MATERTPAEGDSPIPGTRDESRVALDLLARVREILTPELSDDLRARMTNASNRGGPVRKAAAAMLREYRAIDATNLGSDRLSSLAIPRRRSRVTTQRRSLRVASRRGAEHQVVEEWRQVQQAGLREAVQRVAAWADANQEVLVGDDVQLAHLTCTSWTEAVIELARSVDRALAHPRTSTARGLLLGKVKLTTAAWEKLARDLRREAARAAQRVAPAQGATRSGEVRTRSSKRKHASGTLDERALRLAKQWQVEKPGWTITGLARALRTARANLTGNKKSGELRCPLIHGYWNEVQKQRAEAKLARLAR